MNWPKGIACGACSQLMALYSARLPLIGGCIHDKILQCRRIENPWDPFGTTSGEVTHRLGKHQLRSHIIPVSFLNCAGCISGATCSGWPCCVQSGVVTSLLCYQEVLDTGFMCAYTVPLSITQVHGQPSNNSVYPNTTSLCFSLLDTTLRKPRLHC